MEEKEKDLNPDFSLEDILKEFGEGLPEISEEDVRIWDGQIPEEAAAEDAVPSDTVRLDEITRAVRRMEQSAQIPAEHIWEEEPEIPALDETQTFAPVGGTEEPEPDIVIPEDPKVEPYSDDWEPEYEQPMGEYIPPEPITFRPKSRLGELKRKLVAGPEKRYYELMEQGFGKLQLAILANVLVVLLAGAITVLHALGVFGPERIKMVVFCQFLSLLLSALLGSYQLLRGFGDILRKRFSLDSLLIFALLACIADGILCLQEVRVPCCAAFSLCMTMSLWNAYQKRNIEFGQMDTMRKATRLDGIASVEDYYEGRPGFLRQEGQVEDFMDAYRAPSGEERVLSGYALAALLVSVAVGVTAGILHGLSLGVQAVSASLLVAMPATIFVTLSRPMAILERRLHRMGTVLCGWDGVRELSRTAVFPLDDTDLFPVGSAKMNGVKFYSRTPDEVIAYASSLVCACGGTMAPLFAQLLESRGGHYLDIEEMRYYSGGVGAVIENEAVLAGTLQFMQTMGVDMPEGTRVSQAVYVAIDGALAGVFAVTFGKTKASAAGMNTLCSYRRLQPVLISRDFMLSESFLHSRFKCNIRRVAFPDADVRLELAKKQPAGNTLASALTTRDGLASMAYAVTGARAVRSASLAGTVVHMLGGILGLVMLAILAILNASYLLTPVNVLLYSAIWMIPGLLITEWTRSI